MDIEVLVSTMHQKDYTILKNMNLNSSVVVVNQGGINKADELKGFGFNVRWVESSGRGLSRSRNIAIKNSSADICVVADDDLVYLNNYREIVSQNFRLNPDVDIICFQVEGIESKFKNYSNRFKKVGFLSSMKVSSVEIAFRRKSVVGKNIKFNEDFGSGSKYYAGEESIFLFDCLKSGLKIVYVPVKIADLHIGESSWFKGFDEEYFFNKGAIFTGMSKRYSIFLILQFAIRKRRLYSKSNSVLDVINFMLKGRKDFLSENKKGFLK